MLDSDLVKDQPFDTRLFLRGLQASIPHRAAVVLRGGRLVAVASLAGENLGDPLGDIMYSTNMDEILQFDSDAELAFRRIHDYGEAAGADGEVLPEIHIGLDFVPVESCGIHDDANEPFHQLLVLRHLAK